MPDTLNQTMPAGDCPNFRGHRPGTTERWSALADENGTVPLSWPKMCGFLRSTMSRTSATWYAGALGAMTLFAARLQAGETDKPQFLSNLVYRTIVNTDASDNVTYREVQWGRGYYGRGSGGYGWGAATTPGIRTTAVTIRPLRMPIHTTVAYSGLLRQLLSELRLLVSGFQLLQPGLGCHDSMIGAQPDGWHEMDPRQGPASLRRPQP